MSDEAIPAAQPPRSRAEREALVVQWTPLVRKIACRYMRRLARFYELEDLLSIGQQQLWYASRTFDADRGAAFGTYAYYAVFRGYEALVDYWQARRRRGAFRHVCFDEVNEAGIPTLQLPSPDAPVDSLMDGALERRMLDLALLCLRPREAQIVHWRFMEDRSLADIATDLGLTRERIRQLEAKSLVKLRTELKKVLPDRIAASGPVSCYLATPNLDAREERIRGRGGRAPRTPGQASATRKVASSPDST